MSGQVNNNTLPNVSVVPTPTFLGSLGSMALLPAQILAVGIAIVLLVLIAKLVLGIDLTSVWTGLTSFTGAPQGVNPGVAVIVGGLVFLVGLALVVFLWWLAARFFRLVTGGTLDGDGIAALKDLPFALPEGTIRAFLALIVAVVGLPILLFSGALGLDHSIAGYLNGIITGVFAFYFGTRTNAGAIPPAAARTLANAQERVNAAQQDAAVAKADAAVQTAVAGQESRAARFDSTLDQVQRHVKLASALVNTIGPVLPKGVLPDGLLERVGTVTAAADQVLSTVKGIDRNSVSDDQLGRLTQVAGDLIGTVSGNSSLLGALLGKAAPMLGGIAIPGIGPAVGLVSLLSIGARLGSAEFQRWRARVLAAPIANGLIEFGTVTPQDVRSALDQAERMQAALSPIAGQPDLPAKLADLVLRDDGVERMWALWGADSPQEQTLFSTRKDLEEALTEFRQVLVAMRAVQDVPDATAKEIGEKLAGPGAAPTGPSGALLTLDSGSAEKLIAAASSASLKAAAGSSDAPPQDTQAAFDALVMLAGVARRDGVDLARTLREVV